LSSLVLFYLYLRFASHVLIIAFYEPFHFFESRDLRQPMTKLASVNRFSFPQPSKLIQE